MKTNRFAFWMCDKIARKIPTLKTSSTSIPKIAQNFVVTSALSLWRYKWITPYIKTYCWYNIIQSNNIQMGKNLVTTWSMLAKGVRSYQIYYQLHDLCQLTNTKLVFSKSAF